MAKDHAVPGFWLSELSPLFYEGAQIFELINLSILPPSIGRAVSGLQDPAAGGVPRNSFTTGRGRLSRPRSTLAKRAIDLLVRKVCALWG